MLKKILIAVDESLHAKNALLYAANFNQNNSLQLTLLNVQPFVSDFSMFEINNDPIFAGELDQIRARNESNSNMILQEHKNTLINEGIKEKNVNTVSQTRALGLAKDIIDYGRKHRFNAVAIGRRGISRIQKVFMGSASAKLMEHADTLPVWIIDGAVRPRRFLVAVNLNSTAVIDYIAQMCQGMPDIHLTFYYVLERIDHPPHIDK